MIVNKKEIKKNRLFILIVVLLLCLLFGVSFLFTNQDSIVTEGELSDTGSEKYNKLVINEYMSSNGSLLSEDGETYDWIELYNGNTHDIQLKGYGLSDEDDKIKWVFPDVTIEKKSYLIVYLAGQDKEGLYAPFKLKSNGGETITLTKPNGRVMDAVKTVALSKGQSAARDLNGNFLITSFPTPNFANTKEGYGAFYTSLNVDNHDLRINEILPRNNGNFMIDGKFYGYVEIINRSDKDIVLDNYYISEDVNRLYKYKIPRMTLKSGEVTVIYMGNNSQDTNHNYSSFELEKKNGTVYLSNNKGIIDEVTYEDLPNGFGYVLNQDSYQETTILSPGYPNINDGVSAFYKEYRKKEATLLINEVMNNNKSFLPQNGYNFYDWIELYNNSDEAINLKDYTLATDTKGPRYSLPDIVIQPKAYYVVMASGDANLSNQNYTHLDFKISDSESIYLYKDKKVIDAVMIGNVPINYSYGRGEFGFYYISNPTPNSANNIGVLDIALAPTISKESGVYNNLEEVTIQLSAPGTIYYTLDGSNPTSSSTKYQSGITLNKTAVLKATSIEEGKLPSKVITSSYIINENHILPVVSMTVDNSDYNQLLANPYTDMEVQGYLEFYEENGQFTIPCSVSLFGGSARGLSKKSYGIRFKNEFGAKQLVYKLFNNRDTAVYESLVLRSGSQDYEYAFFRDILGTSLVDDYTDVDVQSYKSVILYINGKYYGVYNIREKVNADFIANHYNVDPDKLNLIQGNGEVKNGTADFYNRVLNYVKTHDMTQDKSYEEIKTMLDVENYIDFWIGELYTTNNDIINIRYFSHPDIDDGKMKMIFFDLDWAFYNYGYNYYHFMTNPAGMQEGFNVDNTIFIGLLRNQNFQKDFLTRLSYHLQNTWKKENVMNRFDEIYNKLYPEMERNQQRWNLSFATWIQESKKLKNYIEQRNNYLLQQTKSFFHLSNEQYQEYFGGVV